MREPNKIVLTGGPGIGKTTLLNELKNQGYTIIPEAARMIIEEEQQRDTLCLPWKDIYAFQKKTADRILELEHSFSDSLILCDRGLTDGHAYASEGRVPTPEIIIEEAIGRYEKVFILDQLSTYQTDDSRKESKEKATRMHRNIHKAYLDFGYNPLRVPAFKGTLEETVRKRADFITNLIGSLK